MKRTFILLMAIMVILTIALIYFSNTIADKTKNIDVTQVCTSEMQKILTIDTVNYFLTKHAEGKVVLHGFLNENADVTCTYDTNKRSITNLKIDIVKNTNIYRIKSCSKGICYKI